MLIETKAAYNLLKTMRELNKYFSAVYVTKPPPIQTPLLRLGPTAEALNILIFAMSLFS
ncbi:MAG: hypothetical protein LH478_15365 [Chitinophagaceae bacterium]|nr:hypothetical protein [Chitinophagaceae bacterium]